MRFHPLLLLLISLHFFTHSVLTAQNIHAWQSDLIPVQENQTEYVNICADELYVWHNQLLTESGIYCDTLISETGEDSIFCIDLQVHEAYFTEQTAVICPEEPLIWNGQLLTESGVFTDTLSAEGGCDSIVQITVSALDPLPITMFGAAVCAGNAYEWAGNTYRLDGAYTRSFISAAGCDSMVQLTLSVLDVPPPVLIDTFIFENTTLELNRRFYEQPGEWQDTLPTYFGCDSVLIVRVVQLQGQLHRPEAKPLFIETSLTPDGNGLRVIVNVEEATPVRATLYEPGGRPAWQIRAATKIDKNRPFFDIPAEYIPPGRFFLAVETPDGQVIVRQSQE